VLQAKETSNTVASAQTSKVCLMKTSRGRVVANPTQQLAPAPENVRSGGPFFFVLTTLLSGRTSLGGSLVMSQS
jgi:hypothetical protein